jgi:ABC-type transport system involved in cytochrome bd biosynthesis fused ATPase/permease subunit
VDGQGIGGLSGSTLDALGLAIRKSLTRVFLPNTGFMMLDEPAAAADPDREANMLGLIATSEFDQVLLITHSDIADSFAANVIQL